ncbi:MotA/TolQ/ExbB proton channel family protein [bacterium]|nr:MotA/TolQ/ExbB proton channel family protein [bacterium]
MMETFPILDYFHKGGTVMWPLLFLSVMALTFIIERWWFYGRVTRDTSQFWDQIKNQLHPSKVEQVLLVCNNHHNPLSQTSKAGLAKYQAGKAAAEKAMEKMGAQQLARLEKRLGILASIGNISPLLGFLGTVIGMIKSFDVIAMQGLDNPALVAIGIKEALITTATGLIIAIPTMAAYNYFTTRVGDFVLDLEEKADIVLSHLFDHRAER